MGIHRLFVSTIAAALLLAGCETTIVDRPLPTHPPCAAARADAASRITGSLRDGDGRPLDLARVEAEYDREGRWAGCYKVEASGGEYEMRVPPGSYDVRAWSAFDFDDERYWLLMLTDPGRDLVDVADAASPVISDFVVDGGTPTGDVHIRWAPEPLGEPDGSIFAFRLEPMRPNAAGSTDALEATVSDVHILRVKSAALPARVRDDGDHRDIPAPPQPYLPDIPIGEYRITGELRRPDRSVIPLVLAEARGGTFGAELLVRFRPADDFDYGAEATKVYVRPAGD